jgi:RNA polymerase sigma-19 factor, ECF subfamily
MKRTDTDTIVNEFREGQAKAFNIIFNSYYRSVYTFALRLLNNEAEAQDVTSDAFIKVWQMRDRFTTQEHIKLFLHIVARNSSFNILDKRKTESRYNEQLLKALEQNEANIFEVEIIRNELFKRIYEEIDKLPAQQRNILLLVLNEGLSNEEIAKRLNYSDSVVRNEKSRAIKKLRLAFLDKPLFLAFLMLLTMDK